MNDLCEAKIEEICASPYGYAIFVSACDKTFVIYVDRERGAAVKSAFEGRSAARPLTHEFVAQMLDGLECRVERVVIYDVCDGVFYTRMSVKMSNELGEKLVEIDGRPSDTLSIALRVGAPVCVLSNILDKLVDVSDALKKIRGCGEV